MYSCLFEREAEAEAGQSSGGIVLYFAEIHLIHSMLLSNE